MSVRLQVLGEEHELEELRAIARQRGTTVSAWVRGVLRAAGRAEGAADPARKLQVTAAASRHAFPAPGIEQLNDEIARGYLSHDLE